MSLRSIYAVTFNDGGRRACQRTRVRPTTAPLLHFERFHVHGEECSFVKFRPSKKGGESSSRIRNAAYLSLARPSFLSNVAPFRPFYPALLPSFRKLAIFYDTHLRAYTPAYSCSHAREDVRPCANEKNFPETIARDGCVSRFASARRTLIFHIDSASDSIGTRHRPDGNTGGGVGHDETRFGSHPTAAWFCECPTK